MQNNWDNPINRIALYVKLLAIDLLIDSIISVLAAFLAWGLYLSNGVVMHIQTILHTPAVSYLPQVSSIISFTPIVNIIINIMINAIKLLEEGYELIESLDILTMVSVITSAITFVASVIVIVFYLLVFLTL
ncbi:MAG: hypothetical protein RXQ94_08390 [Caldivirga sp.]